MTHFSVILDTLSQIKTPTIHSTWYVCGNKNKKHVKTFKFDNLPIATLMNWFEYKKKIRKCQQ